jgi:hypothetical protein
LEASVLSPLLNAIGLSSFTHISLMALSRTPSAGGPIPEPS